MPTFEQFVRESLGDEGGNPVQLSGIQTAISLPGNPVDTIGGLIGTIFGGGGNGVGGIGEIVRKVLEEFFKASDENAKFFEELIEAISKALEFSADALQALTKFVGKWASVLVDLVGQIITKFLDALTDDELLKFFPFSFRRSPLDALQGLGDLGQFLNAIDPARTKRVEDRFDLVKHSLTELMDILTGQDGADESINSFILQKIIGDPIDTFKGVLSGNKTPKEALVEFIRKVLDPTTVLKDLQKAFTITSFLSWADLPSGLPIGKVNQWLNDPGTFANDPPNPVERQFRVRMIAELDSYVRRRIDESQQTGSLPTLNQRTSTELIVDLSCIFFDTLINFVLEPECYPIVDAGWENLEDVGGKLGRLMAEQLRSGIRAIIGSLPRGVWQWTLDNENLIEGAASISASIFAPIVEGIIKHFAWSIEIISVYPKQKFPATQPINSFELERWSSLETVGNSMAVADRLEYVAFVRHFRDSGTLTQSQKDSLLDLIDGANPAVNLKGVIRDLGAYIDVGYHRFRIDPFFPDVETEEAVQITRADISGGKLFVNATTSSRFELPRPVLRAYYCCEMIVLTPGATPDDPYTMELSIDEKCRVRDVVVLSNHGGRTTRRAIKL